MKMTYTLQQELLIDILDKRKERKNEYTTNF